MEEQFEGKMISSLLFVLSSNQAAVLLTCMASDQVAHPNTDP